MRASRSIGTVDAPLRVTALGFTWPLAMLAMLVLRKDLFGGAASTGPVDLDLRPVDRCAEPSLVVLLASLSGLVTVLELLFIIVCVDLKKISWPLLIAMLCSTTDSGLTRGVSVT